MSTQEPSVKVKLVKSDLLKSFNLRREMDLDEIVSCQSELKILCDKQYEEKRITSQQFEGLKKPHLYRRTELIKSIPNFWVNALESHPQLCLLLDDGVTEVLRYMTKIETEDSVEDEKGVSFKIHFFFEENPYIENDKLTKEISLLRVEGEIRSSSTAISWKSNQKIGLNEGTSSSASHLANGSKKKNFFVWFCDNENSDDEFFTYFQAICQNPLYYSPLFYDLSDEEVEEGSKGDGGGDHSSRDMSKEVAELNLNDSSEGDMNED